MWKDVLCVLRNMQYMPRTDRPRDKAAVTRAMRDKNLSLPGHDIHKPSQQTEEP